MIDCKKYFQKKYKFTMSGIELVIEEKKEDTIDRQKVKVSFILNMHLSSNKQYIFYKIIKSIIITILDYFVCISIVQVMKKNQNA